jgi:hypothetical protein
LMIIIKSTKNVEVCLWCMNTESWTQ